MALRLTEQQLSNLNPQISPVDSSDLWIITDGGSPIRCNIETMAGELAHVPRDARPPQTLEALQQYRADTFAARPAVANRLRKPER